MKLHIFHCWILLALEVTAQRKPTPAPCSVAIYLVDTRCIEQRHENAAIDTLFDRLVGIVLNRPPRTRERIRAIGTGLWITRSLLLASNNAFMTLRERSDSLERIRVYVLIGRRFTMEGKVLNYIKQKLDTTALLCARQVIPSNKSEPVPDHMRHGIHSPLHDLMVLRINRTEKFMDPIPPRQFDFLNYKEKSKFYPEEQFYVFPTGSIRTIIAKPGEQISDDLSFASLGHIDDNHISQYRFLEIGEIPKGEKVITDCDEWFPREWGYFICLRNTQNYPGIASGGVLFSGLKLFGVGSFALFKGKSSVLVFTDVRPYYHLLHRTCTKSDQNLEIPNH